jgi:hypothetical protein
MADVKNKPVPWCIENAVERDGQFDDPKIWAEMAAGSRKDLDQLIANFLRKLGKILFAKRFHIRWSANAIEEARLNLRRE